MIDKPDKTEGLISGVREGIIETAKLVPGLGILIEGIRKYQDTIEEQQREAFIDAIAQRLKVLEDTFSDPWFQTPDGIEATKKIVATALNAEFVDKIEYFSNAILNCAKDFAQAERLKFIEILRHVSKPALIILQTEHELHTRRGPRFSAQVLPAELIRATGLSPHLVESCINELYSLGVFSSTTGFTSSGERSTYFSDGIPAYTDFTRRFIEFIKDPR